MSVKPCEECARVADTGEGRVLIALTVSELLDAACATYGSLRERFLTAASLLDLAGVALIRADLEA